MRIISVAGIAGVLVFALASALLASVSFTPPGGSQEMMVSSIPLLGQHAAPKANGTVTVVSDKEKKNCTLTLQAAGLDAKKIYTVQYVKTVKNGKKTQITMQGVGVAPYTLTVDQKGNAQMMYKPTSCADVLAWPTIEVAVHTDNNPKGTKMTPVLLGDLSKLPE